MTIGGKSFSDFFKTKGQLLFFFVGFVLVAASSLLFFTHLNAYPMQNWDEGVHAQVTIEMEQSGDYWTPSYQGEQYFRKPPVKFWITAPLVSLFGSENWVFRFWSAVSGVLATLILARFVYEKRKSLIESLFAGLFFISGQFILYHSFRTGEMDGLLVLLITASIYAYWKGRTHPRCYLLLGVLIGFSILTKSLAGMIVPFVVAGDVLLRRDWKFFQTRDMWYGVVAGLVVLLPWHLSMLWMYGKDFWNEYIGFHIVDRTFEQLYADLPRWWYAKMFIQRFFPFSILALGGVITTVMHMVRKKSLDDAFILLWLIVPFVLYTAIETKFEWYIAPLYAAAAFLASRFLMDVYHHVKDFVYSVLLFFAAVGIMALLPKAIIPGSKTFWFAPIAYVPDGLGGFVANSWVLALIVVICGSVLTWLLQKKFSKTVWVVILLFGLYVTGFGYGRNLGIVLTQPTQSPYMTIARTLVENGITEVATFETDFYDKPAAYVEVARENIIISRTDSPTSASATTALITSTVQTQDNLTLLIAEDQYYVYVTR